MIYQVTWAYAVHGTCGEAFMESPLCVDHRSRTEIERSKYLLSGYMDKQWHAMHFREWWVSTLEDGNCTMINEKYKQW